MMAKKKKIFPIFVITLVIGLVIMGLSFVEGDGGFDLSILSALSSIATSVGTGGNLIFEDDFSIDPASNGWTESQSKFTICNSSGSCYPSTAIGTITQVNNVCPFQTACTNEVAQFAKTDLAFGIRLNIDRSFDTSGLSNIGLNLRAFQGDRGEAGSAAPDCLPIEDDPDVFGSQVINANEPAVALRIFVDFGTGFERILIDMQKWNGENLEGWECESEFGGNSEAQAIPTETGILLLDARADNNPNLRVMISTTTYVGSSDYFIDHFELFSDVQILGQSPVESDPVQIPVICDSGTVNVNDICEQIVCEEGFELVVSSCLEIICPIGQILLNNVCVIVPEDIPPLEPPIEPEPEPMPMFQEPSFPILNCPDGTEQFEDICILLDRGVEIILLIEEQSQDLEAFLELQQVSPTPFSLDPQILFLVGLLIVAGSAIGIVVRRRK